MYRFKASKYKNATPKIPKKGEGWILDISVGAPQSFGNHIKASAAFKAFSTDSRGGGSIGLLPIDDVGKKSKNLPLLHAHSELVTDFDFCPYDDGLLTTCSQDSYIKLWRIPENGLNLNNPINAEVTLQPSRARVETVNFNPAVDCVLASAADKKIQLWDLVKECEITSNTFHEELVQCMSWRRDGTQLASTGRDKMIRIWDPRCSNECLEAKSHANNRDSRVVWLGNTDYVLSTGLGSAREREVTMRDVRNLNIPCASTSGESAMGVFIPFYDADTNMLFLVAKGDITVNFWEVTFKEPFLSEASKYMGEVQTKGAGLVPKRALRVMEGEVNRLLLLGQDCIVPVTYQVPRKTYRDFHADIFPDTEVPSPTIITKDWLDGKTGPPLVKVTLDPEKSSKETLVKFGHKLGSGPSSSKVSVSVSNSSIKETTSKTSATSLKDVPLRDDLREARILKERNASFRKSDKDLPTSRISEEERTLKQRSPERPALAPRPAPRTKISTKVEEKEMNNGYTQNGAPPNLHSQASEKTSVAPRQRTSSTGSSPTTTPRNDKSNQSVSVRRQPSRNEGRGFKVRVSKFRHLNGAIGPRETQITNLPVLCKTIPGESEGFRANTERVALPLAISGGHIAVLELCKRGRLQAGVVPSLICGTAVMDFAWDPFENRRLATALDDGRILIWRIPEGGLKESINEPEFELRGHTEKVHFIKFHPVAKDVLASASHDLSIILWDLESGTEKLRLEGHTDQIFSLAWHPDGHILATVCKDQKLRIYEPRKCSTPLQEGQGPTGTRGARVTWTLGGTHLVTTGFNKVSERQVSLYNSNDVSSPLTTEGIDVSPAILIPFYDEDSSTLFLSGKGDSTIFAFEIACDSPHFFPLSHYKCSGPHQAVSFLPKCACNVAEVEFAKAFRLTTSAIEPLSFRVPRLRSEFFQDDLFPDTRITWKPTMTSEEWFSSLDIPPKRISLRPKEMAILSEAPEAKPPAPYVPKLQQDVNLEFEGDVLLTSALAILEGQKEKEEQITNSLKERIVKQTDALPQEAFEGVDPKEWEEEV